MSESAMTGWAALVCTIVVIAGGFAFDAGWKLGGMLCIAMGFLILSALVSAAKGNRP